MCCSRRAGRRSLSALPDQVAPHRQFSDRVERATVAGVERGTGLVRSPHPVLVIAVGRPGRRCPVCSDQPGRFRLDRRSARHDDIPSCRSRGWHDVARRWRHGEDQASPRGRRLPGPRMRPIRRRAGGEVCRTAWLEAELARAGVFPRQLHRGAVGATRSGQRVPGSGCATPTCRWSVRDTGRTPADWRPGPTVSLRLPNLGRLGGAGRTRPTLVTLVILVNRFVVSR